MQRLSWPTARRPFTQNRAHSPKLARADEFAKAAKLHRKLYPVFKACFIEPNPVPIKAALARAGVIGSAEVRAPLAEIPPPALDVLTKALAAIGR